MSAGRLGLMLLLMWVSVNVGYVDTVQTVDANTPLTPQMYSILLLRRRGDHTLLINSLLHGDYEKNYKMISLAMEKIFQVIKQSRQTLIDQNYRPTEGFPTKRPTQEAVTQLIETTCLAADLILYFPEICHRILGDIPNWKDIINWCIRFVANYPHIIDELIAELMTLLYQEINEEARTPNFVNPYYKKADTKASTEPKKQKKPRKKLKRGPQAHRVDL